MASSRKNASKPKPAPRSVEEKLRGLVNLKIADHGLFTQKEWAEKLGVSVRTLRRFKNEKGHKLSPKTIARARDAVAREDRNVTRKLEQGYAAQMRTVTVKGKKKRRPVLVKGVRAPKSRVKQFPVVYPSRAGTERTLSFNVEGWTTEEKIDLIISALSEKNRFTSWHARVMVPPGVARSGRKAETIVSEEDEEEIDEETGEIIVIKAKPDFYMIGPISARDGARAAEGIIRYHEDSGRVIVSIAFVEKVKK